MSYKIKMSGALMTVVAVSVVMVSSASATFTSANYPYTASGGSTADVIHAFGSTIKCTHNTWHVEKVGSGERVPDPATSWTITHLSTSCTAFGLPATVNMTSCDTVEHSHPGKPFTLTTDIACGTAGDAIDINVYSSGAHTTAICHVRIPPQTGKTGLIAANSGSNIVISGTLGGLTATQSRTNAVLCPPGTHTASAAYTVQAGGITLTGDNGTIAVD